ncbi:MAG: thermonuclease family protein [Limnohabitans sp.]
MKIGKSVKFGIAAFVRVGLLLLGLCMLPPLAMAAAWSGLVVGVSDGDTLKVLDAHRQAHTIRLMGIDAPEKAQAFGQRSKQSLSELAHGQRVLVDSAKRDKYGRMVGKVLSEDGRDLCLEQIQRGMAWHYKQYAAEQAADDRAQYRDADKMAQASRLGLWQEPDPTPPWVWRRAKAR